VSSFLKILLGLVLGLLVSVAVLVRSGPSRADLVGDLEALDEEIGAAEADLGEIKGGLLADVIRLRLQTLSLTRDMLDQKNRALLRGISLNYRVEGRLLTPDPAAADSLLSEINDIRTQLADQRAEAEQVGGLLGVMHQTAVATTELTLAMLQQAHVAKKHGLPFPITPPTDTASDNLGTVVEDEDAF